MIKSCLLQPKRPHIGVDVGVKKRLFRIALGIAVISMSLLSGCATYDERVAPVPLPAEQADHVDVLGAKLIAQAYADPERAKKVFGFDIRGSGLLPVRFVIDNQSSKRVRVSPDQTFLVDHQGQAWPLLTAEQAYQRVKQHVEVGETIAGAAKPGLLAGVAGALVGAAVGIIGGQNVAESAGKGVAGGVAIGALAGGFDTQQRLGRKIRDDLARESLRNRRVQVGELAYGYLFFPGKDEAQTAKELRLGLEIGEEQQIVTMKL